MTQPYELEIDHLAVGLTRPAMRMGVPLVPLFMSILACLFGWMLYQATSGNTSMLNIAAFICLWCVMYMFMLWMTFSDHFGLAIAWTNLLHFRKHRTHAFWGNTDSYTP